MDRINRMRPCHNHPLLSFLNALVLQNRLPWQDQH